jgi:putative transposase
MKKLNQRKVRWIIREMEKGELSVRCIARQQDITPQWARALHKSWQDTGDYPYPKKAGRKKKDILPEEREYILKLKEAHPLSGATTLEYISMSEGKRIPHNRIYRVLKEEGKVKDELKKKRRRKWVRYERRHSLSLFHGDWFEKDGMNVIFFEDDASRLVVSYGVFENATALNSVIALSDSIKTYGKAKQVMTDHGVQFTSIERGTCPEPKPNEFQKYLNTNMIDHIKARIKHPQSNGKVEKLGDILYQLKQCLGSWEAAIEYYNFKRPHWSLRITECETPFQAFIRKLRPPKRDQFIRNNHELTLKYAPKYIKSINDVV